MNWQGISGNPFFTVALPLLVGMFVTGIWQGRGFVHVGKRIDDLRDDMNRQFGEVREQLRSIDKNLVQHGERLATLEERTGFVKPAR